MNKSSNLVRAEVEYCSVLGWDARSRLNYCVRFSAMSGTSAMYVTIEIYVIE